MMTTPPRRFATPPPRAAAPRPPIAWLCATVLSRSVVVLPLEGRNVLLPSLASPPPMPALTRGAAVLPSPPPARLWRSVTLLRVRLAGSPDVLLGEVAIAPPVPVPTNWKLVPSPRLPLPPRASLSSKKQSVTVATATLFRPPPNALPTRPFPPVLVLLEPPRAKFSATVLPVS